MFVNWMLANRGLEGDEGGGNSVVGNRRVKCTYEGVSFQRTCLVIPVFL